jgi:hypothetical protein
MKRNELRRTAATIAAGAATAVIVLTGCSSGDDGPKVATAATGSATASASASPSASVDPRDKMVAFTRCLREHGVDVKDAGEDGMVTIGGAAQAAGGTDKMMEAEKACASLAPGGVGEAREPDPEMEDRMLKFARCMREHGIDLPDPGAGGDLRVQVGKDGKAAGAITPDDPKFKAAHEACQDLLGKGGFAVENGSGPAEVGEQ